MKKSLFLSILFLSSAVPFLVSAQSKITDLGNSIKAINSSIITATATLFMALAMAAFFFGIAKFILASRDGDTKEITNGKQFMLWSVIALFVMFSIYGIIRFVQENTIGTNNMNIVLPTFQIGGGSNSTPNDGLGSGSGANNGIGNGSGSGSGSGSCIPNTVCYACQGGPCICNGSSQCVRDYGDGSGASSGSYGGSCNSSAECSSGLSCVSTGIDTMTCRCPGNQIYSGGSCYDPENLAP